MSTTSCRRRKAAPFPMASTICTTTAGRSSLASRQFAVAAIGRWWDTEGGCAYPDASAILILADAGGSNGCRPRLWKQQIQEQLCDGRGLTVTVCHYPTGCSKWTTIEHRLFGPISINWAGKPLRTWETLLGYLRGTTTATGLAVSAVLDDHTYETGRSVPDAVMQTLNLEHHPVCPTWNYTLRPRITAQHHPQAPTSIRELVV